LRLCFRGLYGSHGENCGEQRGKSDESCNDESLPTESDHGMSPLVEKFSFRKNSKQGQPEMWLRPGDPI